MLCALQAGKFDAVLSLADSGIAQALLWRLGSINVTHTATNSPSRSTSGMSMSPKPEIHHIFQQPGKRPPVAVSLTFTALSVAPLGFLLIHLAKLKVDIKVSANPSRYEAHSPQSIQHGTLHIRVDECISLAIYSGPRDCITLRLCCQSRAWLSEVPVASWAMHAGLTP